jgi:hypothetical protein
MNGFISFLQKKKKLIGKKGTAFIKEGRENRAARASRKP